MKEVVGGLGVVWMVSEWRVRYGIGGGKVEKEAVGEELVEKWWEGWYF